MKKIFLIIIIVFVSCNKKELPSNVSMALHELDDFEKICRDYDSLVNTLDESKINTLPLDSLDNIIVRLNVNREMLEERENKVEEFLKYNPELSDYDEIKNRKTNSLIDINENYSLILKRHADLKYKRDR
ncbi:hypothetical protein [Flavobacterium salmonis]|uniref:Uncharacterized protein n=1 Tax=Flavobacterium salmonis TaxID=2654844 RepID=A0A6V6YX86_9FLAO|nr:hypothetical protein [Flavobacterium salmonis]CAD0004100.1 hypothetical protein FLAT13_02039 [Flavobacterium salmonis]